MSAAMVLVVATACSGVRVTWVHDTFGEWRVSPASPPGLRPIDTTGHGTVLSSSDTTNPSPVVLHLEDNEGRVWSYALVGGP